MPLTLPDRSRSGQACTAPANLTGTVLPDRCRSFPALPSTTVSMVQADVDIVDTSVD